MSPKGTTRKKFRRKSSPRIATPLESAREHALKHSISLMQQQSSSFGNLLYRFRDEREGWTRSQLEIAIDKLVKRGELELRVTEGGSIRVELVAESC